MEKRTEKLYQRFLNCANGYLQRNKLDDAERTFASALRQLYNREGKVLEVAMALKGLGFVYKERGYINRTGEDLVKATGLFNAALTRLQEYNKNQPNSTAGINTEIDHLLAEIQMVHVMFMNEILQASQDLESNDYQKLEHYKETLRQIRQTCTLKIRELDTLPALDTGRRHIGNEKERVQAIQRMYAEIAVSMKELVKSMINDCVEVMSSPCCRYAVLGLGSTAREESTPYSDLEFCILVEKDTEDALQYFTHLTNFFHLKVVELGETILPNLGIQSLNNYYSDSGEDDWFFDKGCRGFSFDGAMPWASKVPTGRDKTVRKPWVQPLINTPQNMAGLLSETSVRQEGYRLADVLSNCVLICGEPSLFEDYVHCKREYTIANEGIQSGNSSPHCTGTPVCNCNASLRKQRILQELVEVGSQYRTSLPNYIRHSGGNYIVKRDFYRFPSLILEYLGSYYNIEEPSSWVTINELESNSYLSVDGAHNLRTALSIGLELRLRAYLDNQSQSEYFNGFWNLVAGRDVETPVTLELLLLRYFFTVVPLEDAIKEVSESRNLLYLNSSALYDDSPKIKAQMYFQFRQYYKAKKVLEDWLAQKLQSTINKDKDRSLAEVCKMLGNAMFFLENVTEAAKYYKMALDINGKIYEDEPSFDNLKAVGDSNLNYGCGLAGLGQNKNALPYLRKALEIRNFALDQTSTRLERVACLQDLADAHSNMSALYKKLRMSSTYDDVSIFFHHNRHALNIVEILVQEYSVDHCHHSLYFDQGLMYYNLRKFQESAIAYEKALQLFYSRSKYDQTPQSEASLLNNLANSVIELGDLDKAWALHCRTYEIRKRIHGDKDNNSVARSLNNFGLVNEKAGNFKEAHEFYVQARDMSARINGEDSSYEHLLMYKRNIDRVAQKLNIG